MPLVSFKVTNQKSLRHAEAQSVPRVMVIAGPNGVGKSTLLYRIREGDAVLSGRTRVLYHGPHRVLRRTRVRRGWLTGTSRWLLDLLSGGGEVSGFEGLNFPNSARTPDNVDEAGSTIKHTLGKIENRRQAVLAELVDGARERGDKIDLQTIPDVYEPVRLLTRYLLPHLVFSRIDFKNEDDIRCVWTRTDARGAIDLDIDDLSSGEKSIVVLFLPLLEDQIRERLDNLERLRTSAAPTASTPEDRVFLIDEPEQHLHPDLQAKILGYTRKVARESSVQFVLTTHSPTILDQALDDELYVLSNPAPDGPENQLKRIASSLERLEALKQLAGSAYFLTTGRAIVCIEGRSGGDDDATDLRLFEILYPRSTAFTFVPVGGKGNVITTVKQMREHVPEEVFRIRILGLVDADRSDAGEPGIFALPVCMIENLLLDAEILHAYLATLGIALSREQVDAEIRTILVGMRDQEISLRVQSRIKAKTVRVAGSSIDAVRAAHARAIEEVRAMVRGETELQKDLDAATAEVDALLERGAAIDRFRGKAVLREIHGRHLAERNVSYTDMCLELAKRAASAGRAAAKLDPLFDRMVT